MQGKLTKELLSKIQTEGKELIMWDTLVVGLGARARSSGNVSFVVQYRKGSGRRSRSVRLTLDSIRSMSLDDARKTARSIIGSVAQGADPQQERRAEKIASDRTLTCILEAYDADFSKRKVSQRHRTNTISVLRRGLQAHLENDVSQLTLRDFVRCIENAGGPGARQSLRQRITPMLSFAVNSGLVQHNVMAGWRRPRTSRDQSLAKTGRSLSPNEIKSVWAATDECTAFNNFVRCMMLTGLRNNEAASVTWDWLDKPNKAILIPANITKSGRPHAVPITQQLDDLFTRVPRTKGTSFLFPTKSLKGEWRTIAGFGQRLDKLHERSQTNSWSLYDLRRTYRSTLAELGFDVDLCERMIAHSRGGLVERYDRSTRWDARCDAAQTLANCYTSYVVSQKREQESCQ
jgi:integrase